MEFLIVTGMSGAGKSQAAHALEDIGYFCVDNLPPELLERFVELCGRCDPAGKFAAVMDIRSRGVFGSLVQARQKLGAESDRLRTLFLDAADDVLMNRYKETRRRHPLMDEQNGSVQQAIELERGVLSEMRDAADYVVDTSRLSIGQLKERLASMFLGSPNGPMSVSVLSFGYKYGIPADADLLFDVRCIPNPYYIDSLRPLTGRDPQVAAYVFGFAESGALLEKLNELIKFTLPLYVSEGKCHLVIAVGCTGGRHRSVAFAEAISDALRQSGESVSLMHRDIQR